MRLSTTMFFVLVLSVVFALLRDEVGRVAVIVFGAGLGLTVAGIVTITGLFQTVGAFGEAQTPYAYVEAIVATVFVLAIGSAMMLTTLFGGAILVRWAIP